jgi:hypothetical protein
VKLKESMEVKQGWDQARAACSWTDSVDQIVDRGVGCWAHCCYWAVCLAWNWYVVDARKAQRVKRMQLWIK